MSAGMKTSSPLAWLSLVMLAACSMGGENDIEDEDEYLDPGAQPGDSKTDGTSSVESVVHATCSTAPIPMTPVPSPPGRSGWCAGSFPEAGCPLAAGAPSP